MPQQPAQKWSASSTQISTSADLSTVILDTASGRYFSLEGVGSTLWEALRQPRSFDELLVAVLTAYDVEAETAARDVETLLGDLERAGLVKSV